jgi:transposase
MLLSQLPQGSVIVMDNAPFHRKKVLQDLSLKASCQIIFLPPYSPDLNPIEKTWANLKTFLRNHAYQYQRMQEAVKNYFKVE